jgi:hypothetical protein
MRYLLLLALLLSGCATPELTPYQIEQIKESHIPLICKDKQQCDYYWQRAQLWIAQNAPFKIQTMSDVMIQTYGPIDTDQRMAYLVTKDTRQDGSAHIVINIHCGNDYACYPPAYVAALSFKAFVKDTD